MTKKKKHQNKPHNKKCGAKAKNTGKPCQLPAGWGTDHPGTGRCKFHGGLSTGPPPEKMKKNKNAVTTGENETIWLDALDDDEKDFFNNLKIDVLEQLDEEIKLVNIRIRRMMIRIAKLKKHSDIVLNESEMTFINKEGQELGGNITKNKENALIQIQNIEEALTRVQRQKEKLLKLKHNIEEGGGDEEEKLNQVVTAMLKAAGG